MILVISVIIYSFLFILCFLLELSRNNKWNEIIYPKTRINSKAVTLIYLCSVVFMLIFTIINIIIDIDITLCVFTTITSVIILLIALLISRKSLIITDKEIIKQNLITKDVIKKNEIISIDEGYFLKIQSKDMIITIETKFYDRNYNSIKQYINKIKWIINYRRYYDRFARKYFL